MIRVIHILLYKLIIDITISMNVMIVMIGLKERKNKMVMN